MYVQFNKAQVLRCDLAGELPLEIIRMKAKGCEVVLHSNPGFTLPSNIGELGDDITKLDLTDCSLHGALCMSSPTKQKPIEM